MQTSYIIVVTIKARKENNILRQWTPESLTESNKFLCNSLCTVCYHQCILLKIYELMGDSDCKIHQTFPVSASTWLCKQQKIGKGLCILKNLLRIRCIILYPCVKEPEDHHSDFSKLCSFPSKYCSLRCLKRGETFLLISQVFFWWCAFLKTNVSTLSQLCTIIFIYYVSQKYFLFDFQYPKLWIAATDGKKINTLVLPTKLAKGDMKLFSKSMLINIY